MNAPPLLAALLATAAALAAHVPAQTPVTSPRGLENVEGNMAFNFGNNRRMMIVDNTQNTPLVITAFALRRNGPGGGGTGPGTIDVELHLGTGNYGVMSAEFDRNYTGASKTLVHANKPVNVPDWRQSAGQPAPFDFVVPLDQPYVHTALGALVWDITYTNSAVGSLSIDRDFGTLISASGVAVGIGCTSTGAAGPFAHRLVMRNTGAPGGPYGLTMQIGVSGAPANAPVLLMLDRAAQGLVVPGLCTRVEALPLVTLGVDAADASGHIPDQYQSFPWDAVLEGLGFVTQLLAFDPGQGVYPFSLSNGVNARIPTGGAGRHQSAYLWNTLPAQIATGNLVFTGGSPVAQLR